MLIDKESHQREAFTEWPIRLAVSVHVLGNAQVMSLVMGSNFESDSRLTTSLPEVAGQG